MQKKSLAGCVVSRHCDWGSWQRALLADLWLVALRLFGQREAQGRRCEIRERHIG